MRLVEAKLDKVVMRRGRGGFVRVVALRRGMQLAGGLSADFGHLEY